jgi:CelD/BcsL family acetyltransferase involved in cellulose biosynthesis
MEPALLIAPTAAPAVSSAPAASDVRVETISNYEAFLDLEPVWNNLVEAAGIDHPFLSHEWVRTKWECFGEGKELHILLVKDGTEPIAIAPLMVSHGRMYGLKVRQIESIGNIHTQRFDFIVARSARQAYRAIWKHLLHENDRWDVLQLCQLPAGSRTLEELSKLAAGDGFLTGLWHSGDSPYLPLPGTWESYMKSLNAKHRANLRNRLKRLSRLGEVAVETIESVEHVAGALTDGLRLEAAAWKRNAGTAICCRPELRLFYTKLAERVAKRGWLRLYFLTVDHRRIAFHYSVCWRDKLYLLKPGYDPAYAPYSPSNLLCNMVLHDAFDRGLAEYDFLGAAEPWKLEWTRETKPHYWLFVFPRLWRPRLLYSVKFRLIPRLQQWRFYARLRDIVVRLRTRADARKFARDTD